MTILACQLPAREAMFALEPDNPLKLYDCLVPELPMGQLLELQRRANRKRKEQQNA